MSRQNNGMKATNTFILLMSGIPGGQASPFSTGGGVPVNIRRSEMQGEASCFDSFKVITGTVNKYLSESAAVTVAGMRHSYYVPENKLVINKVCEKIFSK